MNTAIGSPDTERLSAAVDDWARQAEAKLRHAPLTAGDLAELRELVDSSGRVRQRLLYLHTTSPSPRSQVVAMDRLDPVHGGDNNELTPDPEFPYASVWDAMVDGWQVVQFPEYRVVVQDHEIDLQGYQFILQKFEVYRD